MLRSSLKLASIGWSRAGRGGRGHRLGHAWPGCAACVSVVAVWAMQVAVGGARVPHSDFATCGSDPARLAFHIQTRGISCAEWTGFAKLRARASAVKVIEPRKEWGYRLPALPGISLAWTCIYRTVPGPAQDNELTRSDCRSGETMEVRWTDSPNA
jgi:hypothetical protein